MKRIFVLTLILAMLLGCIGCSEENASTRPTEPGVQSDLTGGSFRVPGKYRDFAMYHPLEEGPAPTYFGIPLD